MINKNNFLIGSGLALALVAAVWSPVQAQQVSPEDSAPMTPAQMAECCKDVKDHRRQLTEEVKAHDVRLTEKVAEMNRAPADRKVALLAGVVTMIAEQRVAIDARRATIGDEMSTHMMQHMRLAGSTMPHCPVMKAGNDKDDTNDSNDKNNKNDKSDKSDKRDGAAK